VLTISEPRRYRNKAHLRFVATKPCLICGRRPSDAHHLRFTQPRAMGRKVSDEYTVPLCRTHHRANHRAGDERAWWRQLGMDPVKIARDLWRETRGARFAVSGTGSEPTGARPEPNALALHKPPVDPDVTTAPNS
jgi:hypothetical protein